MRPNFRGGYLGIDPGKSGGFALIYPDGKVTFWKMPDNLSDLYDSLSFFQIPIIAAVEKVGGYVHGNPAPGSAMFNFGTNYGAIKMALVALSISFQEIPPQRWMTEFSLRRNKTETKTVYKNRIRDKARQLFPDQKGKITLKVADALLLAEYARRKL